MKNYQGMKTIEEIIRNNRDFFEDEEPSEGHFERFNRKLEMRFHARKLSKEVLFLTCLRQQLLHFWLLFPHSGHGIISSDRTEAG